MPSIASLLLVCSNTTLKATLSVQSAPCVWQYLNVSCHATSWLTGRVLLLSRRPSKMTDVIQGVWNRTYQTCLFVFGAKVTRTKARQIACPSNHTRAHILVICQRAFRLITFSKALESFTRVVAEAKIQLHQIRHDFSLF